MHRLVMYVNIIKPYVKKVKFKKIVEKAVSM